MKRFVFSLLVLVSLLLTACDEMLADAKSSLENKQVSGPSEQPVTGNNQANNNNNNTNDNNGSNNNGNNNGSIPETGYTVRGRVLVGNQGIKNITVKLTSQTKEYSVNTDVNGNFLFSNAIEGSYELYPLVANFTVLPAKSSIALTTGYNNNANYIFNMTLLYWENVWGGTEYDSAKGITQSADGDFVAVGNTLSYGSGKNDLAIVKYSANSQFVWEKILGGAGNDEGLGITATVDSGVVVCGYTSSKGAGLNDGWLVKLNAQGNQLWEKVVGEVSDDRLEKIITLPDGYAAVGSKNGADGCRGWLVVVNNSGEIVTDKCFGSSTLSFHSIKYFNNKLYVCGYSEVNGNRDMLLYVTDMNGGNEAVYTFGGAASDEAFDLLIDDEIYLAGYTRSQGAGDRDIWLVKIDKDNFNIIDEFVFGTSGAESINSICKVGESYILGGYQNSSLDSNSDVALWSVDSDMNHLWEKYYGTSKGDICNEVISLPDGFIFAGSSIAEKNRTPDMWLMFLYPNGNMVRE